MLNCTIADNTCTADNEIGGGVDIESVRINRKKTVGSEVWLARLKWKRVQLRNNQKYRLHSIFFRYGRSSELQDVPFITLRRTNAASYR